MMSAFLFPIYLATNKIIQREIQREDRKQLQKEDRGTWYQERPIVDPDRPEREAKLTHGNLQISKCLCNIIRSCNKYKCQLE